MSHRPVIALTLDHEPPGGYASLPWYALRENYVEAVLRAGGLPVALPHAAELAESYLALADGVLVTGGAFDVDPRLFGAAHRHPSVVTKDRRTAFEIAVTEAAIDRDKPLLAICGGAQLLNVALGGTLIQHIDDEIAGALAHEQPNPRDEPGHSVRIAPGTRLERIYGEGEVAVNSAHHQAVRDLGRGLVVDAVAPDGVVEGIEHPGLGFCIGVQWHPEYGLSAGDHALFVAFVDAARG